MHLLLGKVILKQGWALSKPSYFKRYFHTPENTKGGFFHCTVDPLFDWSGFSYMTTDSICFYLQNRLIQISQTGGQRYSDTSPFSIPCIHQLNDALLRSVHRFFSNLWIRHAVIVVVLRSLDQACKKQCCTEQSTVIIDLRTGERGGGCPTCVI